MDKAAAALLNVRLAMRRVFERERVPWGETPLFTDDPLDVREDDARLAFLFPGAVYGCDLERDVVWENPDVPGVDARRFFDVHGRDLEAEAARLRELVERVRRLRR